jgi:S-adenosyl methyltransferase
VAPEYPQLARANRVFLERAVRLVAQAGVRQFIDLGTGIPTSPSVHEVAMAVDPSSRVLYLDNDPIVSVHRWRPLADTPGTKLVVLGGVGVKR